MMAALFSLLALLFHPALSITESRVLQETSCDSCRLPHPFDPAKHKEVYSVGVLDFRGEAATFALHNVTFANYLTATVGQRFDPPIRFEMKAIGLQSMYEAVGNRLVDYLYVSPSPFACIEAEYGAETLVSHISKRVIGDNAYELSQFGGVIATRADNDEINSLQDLKGKVVASVAISAFGGGQMQFREVQNAGLSYINDPKQMVFTGNQGQIVNGVINGDFDVGFVRTDQIQRTNDADGNPVDPSLLKVLESKDNGDFPFEASTQLYPEWNLAALSFAPDDVSAEVQAAMLALYDHSRVGFAHKHCIEETSSVPEACDDISQLVPGARCDANLELGEIAMQAMVNGKYAGFRTTLSYIDIRAMLQDTDFIRKDEETNLWRCTRPAELYEAISCPPGHFKKTKEEVEWGCYDAGMECKEGHTCVCNPCVKSFDVDVFPILNDMEEVDRTDESDAGCAKMGLCGSVQQTKELTFRAIDNKKRLEAKMTVTIREGGSTRTTEVKQNPASNVYEFTVSAERLGVLILEIALDNEQIPESPLRVEVEERDCSDESDLYTREADSNGNCVCSSNAASFGDNKCVPYSVLLPSILAPIALIVAVWVYFYVERKKREADSVWMVKQEELHFATPQEVIGAGSFGLVLKAEYRGTQVAVKRVLPPREQGKSDTRASGRMRSFDYEIELGPDKTKNAGMKSGVIPSLKRGITSEEHSIDSVKRGNTSEEHSIDSGSIVNERLDDVIDLESSLPSKSRETQHQDGFRGITSGVNFTSIKIEGSKDGGSTEPQSGRKSDSRCFFFRQGWRSKRSEAKQDFIKEMRLLSKLRHPCITTVMGACVGQDPLIVMEFMDNGSLYDLLHNETMFMEGEILLHILQDVSQGVRFLHAANPAVVHGDLKSANILVDSKFRAKVADFGLAQRSNAGAMGTPFWMAPELLRGESANTTGADMYAIGIILYEMYSRKDPYEGEDHVEVLKLVCDKKVNKRPPVPASCPSKVAKLMKSLLMADPAVRPTAKTLDNRIRELDASNVEAVNIFSHRFKKEQPQNGNMNFLYQAFPKHVADVLANGGKVKPENHEIITIFFSDIVGFTTIAANNPAMKVSSLLDRLYLAFDDLARKYDLFKIETIGDAYMCAANLAKEQEDDHAKRIAEFAIDAMVAASEIPIDVEAIEKGYVQIRVGFHSGPVVSNVVGSLNPRYGIFGDTVNVASRMESTSEPGRIHCSKRSAQLLMNQAPDVQVRLRGQTAVKGKGRMATFWVNRNLEQIDC